LGNFTVYSSSAGSGKTFTLTKEFLKIILSNSEPMYFRHVLAITFTNAASSEMKDRLMKALKGIIESEDNAFGKLVSSETGIDLAIIRGRAKTVFEEIINNYSLLSIMTLDAFSSQVVNTFKFDLNLPFSFETLLDKRVVISEAVKNVFDHIGSDTDLEHIIRNFAMSKLDEDVNWQNLAKNIYDQYLDFFENDANTIKDLEILNEEQYEIIRKKVEKNVRTVLNIAKTNGGKAMALFESKGLDSDDFPFKSRGFYSFFNKCKNLTWTTFDFEICKPNVHINNALNNDEWAHEKSKNKQIISEIKHELRQLATEIVEVFDPIQLFVYQSFLKKVHVFNLMKRIENEVNVILADKNQAFLSSFGDKINTIVKDEPVPFIYERLGEYYNHILLDEFQDTSSQQFTNLLPLLENTLAKGMNSLLVGDEKQSIYSFRGGNGVLLPLLAAQKSDELIDNLSLEFHQQDQLFSVLRELKAEKLAFNYRSSREIIEFNNNFFKHIADTSDNANIQAFFGEVHQDIPETAVEGGFVEFRDVENDLVNLTLKTEIQYLLSIGYGLGDMAVLVNSNSDGSQIASFLNKAGFEINTVEALNIKNKPEINFIITLLKVAQDPDNTFFKFSCLQFFLQWKDEYVENIGNVADLPIQSFLSFFEDYGYKIDFEKLLQDDYYRVSEYLIQSFELFDREGLADFIFCFLDLILNFSATTSTNLSEFLEFWDLGKNFSVSNSKTNAITISTIHKSKGLEYPVVFIPQFNWRLTPNKPKDIWVDFESNDLEFPELAGVDYKIVTLPLKPKKDVNDFFIEFRNQVKLVELENSNKIYVAFTRASERLYVWSPELSKEKSSTCCKYLKSYLAKTCNFNHTSQKIIFEGKEHPLVKHLVNEAPMTTFDLRPIDFETELKIRFSEYENVSRPEITFGKEMHAALEMLGSLEDLDAVLVFINQNPAFTEAEKANAEQIIKNMIGHPDLAACFSTEAKVKIEADILQKNQKIYRPDRISIVNDKTYIIDYKTGSRIEGKTGAYDKQIRNYGKLLAQMGYSNVQMYIVYFQNFEVIKVDFAYLESPKDIQLNIF
jgi:ATP-dependent helicase/nuclease subunit A